MVGSGRKKTRYAVVGTGGRVGLYLEAIVDKYSKRAELAGLCDINRGRLEHWRNWAQERGTTPPIYSARNFRKMIEDTRPDCVIVTSKDATHARYICRAMEMGCDVLTEKPLTIDARRCRRIVETERRTGRKCRVTFNYRYSPPRTQVKDLLMSGVIGDVVSVDFHWMLNDFHGADYFRRWHRNKANSGGLLVHKATHHFDLVNWWLGTVPESVYATGRRVFYTPATADELGLKRRGDRCHGCPEEKKCGFHLGLAKNEGLKKLYFDCESYDGYQRDRCVFSDEIDIEDSMALAVDYRSGAKMSYSLNAFAPWEGYTISFNGTAGRLEHKCEETVYVNADGTVPGALKREGTWIRIYPRRKPAYDVDVWQTHGGHGGGDEPMIEDIFAPARKKDKYMRAADHRSGAWAILTGVAANRSIASGRRVDIAALVSGLDLPDYP